MWTTDTCAFQHPEAVQAWRFLQRNFYLRHQKTAWVSPYDGGTAAWTQQSGKQWIKFTFEKNRLNQSWRLFSQTHMQFQFGTTSGFQKEGIMMGQAAGGAIFRMVLVAHEVQALQSNKLHKHLLDLGSCRFFGIRFVDDLRIFVVYPLFLPWACMGFSTSARFFELHISATFIHERGCCESFCWNAVVATEQ